MTRHYTVELATRTLPYVRAIVDDIRECHARLDERVRAHKALGRGDDAARATMRREIAGIEQSLRECLRELAAIDVEMKDPRLGLVDFPAELDGRPILLCWQFGEDRVAHWHELDGGYVGRQPVPADEPAWPASATYAPAAPD